MKHLNRTYALALRGVSVSLIALGALSAFPALSRADDWPQWRGPARTGISKEKGLLKAWPAAGPKLLWSVKDAGGGYCTPSVAHGKIFGLGYRGNKETAWAYDAATGKEVWSTPLTDANRRGKGYGEGSRSTPTVEGDRVYVLGDSGDFACLETKTGNILWRKDLVADFGGAVPNWGYSESPLIDGDKVIVTPGGSKATLVALNKKSGDVIWQSPIASGNGAHYASAIIAIVDGVKQYIQFLGGGAVGVAAEDGKLLWRYEHHAGVTANIATPIYSDNHVFISAAYGTGGGLVRLTRQSEKFAAEEVYFTQKLKSKHGGMVLWNGCLYGMDDPRTLVCIDYKTGKVLWSNESVGGNASVFLAEGMLYVRSQRGTIALVEATPGAYNEKGRFDAPERTGRETWAHPVVANGRLYLRDQNLLYCYEVKR